METGIDAVLTELTSGGLQCKGAERAADEAVFTGLVFEKRSGEISLSRTRLWRLRLGLRHLALSLIPL